MVFDKIIDYIFTPPVIKTPKDELKVKSNPIPDGYTIDEPEKRCDTCILYHDCPETLIKCQRSPTVAHWPGSAMIPAYPIDYPPCRYHTTVDDIIKWRSD